MHCSIDYTYGTKVNKGHLFIIIHTNPYLTQAQDSVDIIVILFHLLPEPQGLVVLDRIDVLGPATFDVVHALAQVLGSLGVDLQQRKVVTKLEALVKVITSASPRAPTFHPTLGCFDEPG